jgi:DNA-binding NtrC family response regulator
MEERILIVDDELRIREILKHVLHDEGYVIRTAENGYQALQITHEFRPDLILMDQKMPGISGIEATEKIKEHYPNQTIIIITAHGAVSFAVEAIKKGAYDYLEKPFDNDKLIILIKRALQFAKMNNELNNLRKSVNEQFAINNIIGNSRSMQQVINQIKSVCQTDATILLQGESGVGKEVIANAIHFNSNRRSNPLVVINCGAIPLQLVESELFGHEKGAFTDAKEMKTGKFEQANEGTLFLDEVGELPLESQVKLLRVLEDRKVTRVGGKKSIPLNVRIISATNRNLENHIKQGKFRLDLMYRLNIFTIDIPPLRERKEDIPLLVEHFIKKYNRLLNLNINNISQKAIDMLESFNWPGNIRDLENAIQSSMILAQGNSILQEHLPMRIRGYQGIDQMEQTQNGSLDEKVKLLSSKMEKELILDALRACSYNRTETAKALKISRKTLFNKMKFYKL